jgi:NADPH:quinone reductase-like Zn-dependent oxidoreductase
MRAAVRDRYGPPSVVRVEEVAKPVPRADQVLIRATATSVNRADLDGLYPRWQVMRSFMGVRRPRSRGLGTDVAGVVEEVGSGVTRLKVGDRVFGDRFAFGGGGTFAEYVCGREKGLGIIPADITDEVAATLPHAGVLAVQGLRGPGGRVLRAGQRLLVVGASGNVGPFAVQIAKVRGVHVTGVARAEKLDFVRSLGADETIDYQTTDYTQPAEPYDWIVDVDAHHRLLHWRRALKPGGVYVALGGSMTWLLGSILQSVAVRLASNKRLSLMLWWKPFNPADVETLLGLLATGKVKPAIDRVFPLDQIVEALEWVDKGKARGKVVVLPSTGVR